MISVQSDDFDVAAEYAALRDSGAVQREMLEMLKAQHRLQEQQLERSQRALAESLALQQLALRRQRTVTLVAVPGIVLCVGLIGWLLLRYF